MRRLVKAVLGFALLIPAGSAWGQASPSAFTSAARYDAARRVTGTISAPASGAAGPFIAVRNTYDAAGRLVKVETGKLDNWQSENVAPVNWAGFEVLNFVVTAYDALDRKVREGVWSGTTQYQVTQYSYDAAGRLECTAVRMQPAVFGSLPASACVQSVTVAPWDRISKQIHDAAGQVLQVRKGVGTTLEQAYATYGYTPNGKQEYVVDANGNKARFVYDGHDRLAQWQFPSPSAPAGFNPATPATALASAGAVNSADREEYGYDANGNRTSLRKRDGRTFGYSFDALNRMTSKIVPDACVAGYACTNVLASMTRDVYYTYDLRGLQTGARFDSVGGADAVTSAYDGFGRQTSSTTSLGGASRTLTYQYDADGNRTRITHPDGHFVSYFFDGLDRNTFANVDDNPNYGAYGLYYDAAGRRTYEDRLNTFINRSFDGISRLTGSNLTFSTSAGLNTTSSFDYNPASQIVRRTRSNDAYAFDGYANVSRSYAANGLSQYTVVGQNAFSYDSNGNLVSDGTSSFSYDAENRLVTTSSGASLVYDPLGRLFQTSGGAAGVTQFLYDGDQLTQEYSNSGAVLRRYVHGADDDDPLIWYEGSGTSAAERRSLGSDHQGSIVSVASIDGTVIDTYNYDEYGIPGGRYASRFQYTGQAWIPELGMYYYKARIYSPTLGRFLQTDPIGYEDQINLYAYVANDPVNGRDPTGTEVEVNGSKKDVKEFVQQASQLTGLRLKVSKGGELSISGKGKGGNAEAASALTSAINSSNTISVNAVQNDPNVFIDSYANNKVDVGDIGAFAKQDKNFGAAALTHVISERMDAASNGGNTAANFGGAHSVALGAEARAMNNGSVTRTESLSGSFSGPGTMTIRYVDSSGNVVKTFTVSIGSGGVLK